MEKLFINGINLAYEKTGNGGKAVILLHGNGENHKTFDKMLTKLDDFTCYAVDTRGHGESDFKEPFTIEQFAYDIMAFCERLDIKRAIFIGYSDGANILMKLAVICPQIIAKMVLLSGNLYASATDKIFDTISRTIFLFTRPFWFCKRAKRKGLLQKIILHDIGVTIEDLQKFDIPAFVIGAEKDIISNAHTKFIANSIKNSKLYFAEGTTHFNMFENDILIKEVVNFLK